MRQDVVKARDDDTEHYREGAEAFRSSTILMCSPQQVPQTIMVPKVQTKMIPKQEMVTQNITVQKPVQVGHQRIVCTTICQMLLPTVIHLLESQSGMAWLRLLDAQAFMMQNFGAVMICAFMRVCVPLHERTLMCLCVHTWSCACSLMYVYVRAFVRCFLRVCVCACLVACGGHL